MEEVQRSPTRRRIIHVDARLGLQHLAPLGFHAAAQNGDRVAVLSADTDSAPWRPGRREDQVVGTLQTAMPNAPVTAHSFSQSRLQRAQSCALGHHRPVVVVARVQAEDVAR
jgi:hypothetical protein